MPRATVTLKTGKSYHWLGYVFSENKGVVITNPSHLVQCKTNGLLTVSEDEDEPVMPLKPKAKLAPAPVEETEDEAADPEPEEQADGEGEVAQEGDDAASELPPASKPKPGQKGFKPGPKK